MEYSDDEREEKLKELEEKAKQHRVNISMRLDLILRAILPLSDVIAANEEAKKIGEELLIDRTMEFAMKSLVLMVSEVQHKYGLCGSEYLDGECGYLEELMKFRSQFSDLISEDNVLAIGHESE